MKMGRNASPSLTVHFLSFPQKLFLRAYEVKNNLLLFEWPYKIQKNGVCLFEDFFSVLEIFAFFTDPIIQFILGGYLH